MADVTIKISKNGPYLITGDIELVDHELKPVTIPTGKKNVALCRCGASVTKPFCDGTHSRIGFRAAEEAAKEHDDTQRA